MELDQEVRSQSLQLTTPFPYTAVRREKCFNRRYTPFSPKCKKKMWRRRTPVSFIATVVSGFANFIPKVRASDNFLDSTHTLG